MYYYVPKSGKRVPLGTDFAAAMVEYARLVQPATGALATMGAGFDRYQAEVLPLKAPRTQRDNLIELGNLRKEFADFPPAKLDTQHIYRYMDKRKAPVRANREKALLSHVCTYLIRWGAMRTNPCKGVARNTEIPRDRCPSPAELGHFKEAAAGLDKRAAALIRLYVDFKYKTSMRKGDLLKIHLTQLKADGIRYTESKKRRRKIVNLKGKLQVVNVDRKRVVRWDLELRLLVDQIRALPRKVIQPETGQQIETTFLFCRFDGKPYTETGFDSMWQRAMERFVAAGGERFHEHDVRAASATADPKTAAERLGDTEQQAAHYVRRHAEDAYDPIPLRKAG